MADIRTTKIIFLRGKSEELPYTLSPGELAFATDEGRLFIGSDPIFGQPQYRRSEFPGQNIEILTENSKELFAKMHGDRLREGGGLDFYDARLEPFQSSWTAVRIPVEDDYVDYTLVNVASIACFIDYTVTNNEGIPLRMGNMLMNYSTGMSAPALTDNGTTRRDLTLMAEANYLPEQVYGLMAFRFKLISGAEPTLVFQYCNYTDQPLNLRFKTSRPAAVYYSEEIRDDEIIAALDGSVTITMAAAGVASEAVAIAPATIPIIFGIQAQGGISFFSGLSWTLPCTDRFGSGVCGCAPQQLSTHVVGGSPATTYNVSVRVRGIVETKIYTGGVATSSPFAVKNATGDGNYLVNNYTLEISSPAATYFLNHMAFDNQVHALDYHLDIAINGGATMTLRAVTVDNQEHNNVAGLSVTDDDLAHPIIVAQPYVGQFLQIDGTLP